MSEDPYGGRIERLEVGLTGLSTDFASVKADVRSMAASQVAILAKLSDIDRSRPGISSILPWLGAGLAVLTVAGGAYVQPLIARVDKLESIQVNNVENVTRNRIAIAILQHDAEQEEPMAHNKNRSNLND